jgi:hypothetical protein
LEQWLNVCPRRERAAQSERRWQGVQVLGSDLAQGHQRTLGA